MAKLFSQQKWKLKTEFVPTGTYTKVKKANVGFMELCGVCGFSYGEHYGENCPNRKKEAV